ncbi:MAG: oligosaccharide flippase family protein [Ignavibacteriaceae bacterium]|nr:oligosaccharide flippase family protein [Ignavibacteriaceae bacterium]HRN27747.1 oligosaccharide flippase family protein [Ignavibacteriaceae bacterium]HRP92827.1 oligosaccharide flippase family protein [Ignavibacteriaceae bacterium]HRQ55384.1 oligosaccharide flippase family protein [Ignavibacteriaceae bacterium]
MKEKLKELTKDTAVYGISTMLGRFLNFLLVPFYTNVFLPAEYGVVNILYSYIAIFNIIFIYGMDSAYLKYSAFKDIGDDKENFSTPYISVFLTSVLFIFLIFLFVNPITTFLEIDTGKNSLVVLSALILFFDANVVIPFLKLRLERKAKTFSLYRVINILINIILNVYLILFLKWGIEAIFISNLTASVLTLVLIAPTIFKNFKFSFHKVLFKRLLKFGLPYLPAGIAVMLVQVIDVPILQKLTDLKTVGIYKANYKLGIFMMLFVNMFQFAWQPFFLNNAKEENAKELFSKVLTYFTIVGSSMLVFLSLFIDDIVKINFGGFSLIGSDYWTGLYIVPVILLAYLFNGFYVVFSAGIYIEEKSIYAPIVAGLGALTNVAANYILIPYFNIMGAAIATLLSYVVMASGYYIVTQKFYKINYDYIKLVKIIIATLFIGVVYYLLMYGGFLNIYYKIILAIIFISYILTNVFEKKEMNFIKSKLLRR